MKKQAAKEKEVKLTLITNLHYVQQEGSDVRMHVYALLLEEDNRERMKNLGARYAMRGFLSDGGLEVFDMRLQASPFPFELTTAESKNAIFIGCDGEAQPLSSGAIMKLEGLSDRFSLIASDGKRKLDMSEYDDYPEVWDALPGKVAEYWQAPYMPVGHWESAESVRAAEKIKRRNT